MVDKKTSQEDDAGALDGTELVRITKGGVSRRTVAAAISALATGGLVSGLTDSDRVLRRPINARRVLPAASNRTIAYGCYEAARKTNTDGGLTVWEPDGVGHYGSMWTRDVAMAMESYLEYFTAPEISAVFSYILGKSNATTREVPDHISHTGAVRFYPSDTGTVGARAPIDGNFFILQLAWLHYIATGSATLYSANRVTLKSFIEAGISYGASGCVNISDSAPYVGFGFYDTPILTGDVLFPSCLAYRAFQQAAVMESALGFGAEAQRLLARAATIRSGINSALLTVRAGAGAELGTAYSAREMAYYFAATTRGATQIDLWGTAFAVWCGIPSEADARRIANYLLYVSTANADNVYQGGLRHVAKASDFSSGVSCWQSYFLSPAPTYGTYQNGGFWPTPLPWLAHAVALVEPETAQALYAAFLAFQATQGASAPGEWWTSTGVLSMAGKYLTSCAPLLMLGDAASTAAAPAASTGGNSLAAIDPDVPVTGATTLTSAAFGKMHVCSGTTASYAVTLPTATGNAGKFIGFRADKGLTYLVTLTPAGGSLIDFIANKVLWANESCTLYCNGVDWIATAQRRVPIYLAAKRASAQSMPAGVWTAVVMDATITNMDNTSSLAATVRAWDSANGRFRAPRGGLYRASGFCSLGPLAAGIEIGCGCAANGAAPNDNPNAITTVATPASTFVSASGGGSFWLAAGEYINTVLYNGGGAAYPTRSVATVLPTLEVSEVLI